MRIVIYTCIISLFFATQCEGAKSDNVWRLGGLSFNPNSTRNPAIPAAAYDAKLLAISYINEKNDLLPDVTLELVRIYKYKCTEACVLRLGKVKVLVLWHVRVFCMFVYYHLRELQTWLQEAIMHKG